MAYQKFSEWVIIREAFSTGKEGVKAVIIPDPARPLFKNGNGISLRGTTEDGRAIETSPIAEFVNLSRMGAKGIWAVKTESGSTYHVQMDDALAKKIVGTFYKHKNPQSGPTATPAATPAPMKVSDEDMGNAYAKSMQVQQDMARLRMNR